MIFLELLTPIAYVCGYIPTPFNQAERFGFSSISKTSCQHNEQKRDSTYPGTSSKMGAYICPYLLSCEQVLAHICATWKRPFAAHGIPRKLFELVRKCYKYIQINRNSSSRIDAHQTSESATSMRDIVLMIRRCQFEVCFLDCKSVSVIHIAKLHVCSENWTPVAWDLLLLILRSSS